MKEAAPLFQRFFAAKNAKIAKGGGGAKELVRGRTKNDIGHVVSSAQKATLPIVSNLNDILTMR